MPTRRVFVMGAANPNGGTFMAYQLGRILQAEFGFEPVAVRAGKEIWDHAKHDYVEFPIVSMEEMEARIGSDDILIANPSFSKFMFGLRLPGLKISYVQGFQTFAVLDTRFDHYVSVSPFVQKFLLNVYDLSTPVIPPYIDPVGSDIDVRPWRERPPGSTFVYLKGDKDLPVRLRDRLELLVGSEVRFSDSVTTMSLPRSELFSRIAACRFFLSLSAAEGFGLVPLEAMSLGTVVTGFDGFGGRQYMRSMDNCAVAPWADIEQVAAHLTMLSQNDGMAMAMAERGRQTASQYTFDRFRELWKTYFRNTVGLAWSA